MIILHKTTKIDTTGIFYFKRVANIRFCNLTVITSSGEIVVSFLLNYSIREIILKGYDKSKNKEEWQDYIIITLMPWTATRCPSGQINTIFTLG